MDSYQIWCNLKDSRRDLEFCRAVSAYLDYLRGREFIAGYRITRRKLGFGPPGLGEFSISIEVRDLAQLELAFSRVARRDPEIEALHHAVYSAACDLQFALYRDFPDPVRSGEVGNPPPGAASV